MHKRTRLLAVLLVLLLLVACRTAEPPGPGETATRSGQQLLVLPEDGVEPVLDLIEGAEQSIRLKIYLFTQRDVQAALVRAANRGVQVRVLMEPEPTGGGESNRETFERLRAGGVQVQWAPSTFRLTHEKTLIVDEAIALTGTFNYTASSFTGNREYGLLLRDPALVAGAVELFEADWAGRQPALPAGGPLIASPTHSRAAILRLINEAGQSLWLEQSTLLDDEVAAALAAAARRGVDVRFIGPRRQEEEDFAEPNYQRLQAAGASVGRLANPLVHAKIILADGRQALIGSINLTYSSLDLNRELAVLTTEPAVIARLRQTFEADWAAITRAAVSPAGVIDWQEAGDYVGAEVTVEGEIARTYDSGKVTFLNFTQDYRGTLSIVIFASAYEQWPQPPAEYFQDSRVRVRGLVKLYEGAPEIIVESPGQIERLDGAAAASSVPLPTATTAAEPSPPATPPGPAAATISWQEAGQYLQETVTVEGEIVRTYDSGKATFLNFTQEWRGTLSVVIFASDYGRFPAPPSTLFLDKVVRVSGRVQEYEGAPEIIVESPGQIEIVGGEVATPPTEPPSPPAGVVPWQEAGAYQGQTITVSGRVLRAYDAGSITFLNFSAERDQFVAVVFAGDYGAFEAPPAALYEGKLLWITGEIGQYQGVPQVVIHSPAQVEIFE